MLSLIRARLQLPTTSGEDFSRWSIEYLAQNKVVEYTTDVTPEGVLALVATKSSTFSSVAPSLAFCCEDEFQLKLLLVDRIPQKYGLLSQLQDFKKHSPFDRLDAVAACLRSLVSIQKHCSDTFNLKPLPISLMNQWLIQRHTQLWLDAHAQLALWKLCPGIKNLDLIIDVRTFRKAVDEWSSVAQNYSVPTDSKSAKQLGYFFWEYINKRRGTILKENECDIKLLEEFVTRFTADPSCALTSVTKKVSHPCDQDSSNHTVYVSTDPINFPYHVLLPYSIVVTYINDLHSFNVLKSFLELFKLPSSRPSCALVHVLCHNAAWRARVQTIVTAVESHLEKISSLDYRLPAPSCSLSTSIVQTVRYGVLINAVFRPAKETQFFEHSAVQMTNLFDSGVEVASDFITPWQDTVDPAFYSKLFAQFVPLPHLVDTLWALKPSASPNRAISELETLFPLHVLILGHGASSAVISAGCWKLRSTLILSNDEEYTQFTDKFQSAQLCTSSKLVESSVAPLLITLFVLL